jgi:cytosine/adenosine deaminase-related metal-dependent hydrolase
MILRARHVLTAEAQTMDNGAVRIEHGMIAEVAAAADLRGEPATDLGDCLLLPGLVNAHTHLELTHLAGLVPPKGDFVGWLGQVATRAREQADNRDTAERAVLQGSDLSLTEGVTTIGDVSRWPALTRPLLAGGPLRVVSFGEVIAIGTLRDRLGPRLAAAADRTHDSAHLRAGVSPHAPYTLEPEALQACADRAAGDHLALCMHLTETAYEIEFTTALAGPLRQHLEALGVWDDRVPRPGRRPIDFAAACGILAPHALLAHVNYATDHELDRIAASGAHVAYCPRTHHAFGHPPHRFLDMLQRGINVCIGTDSLASNPSLSVVEELRFLRRRYPDLPVGTLIELGTIHGARALGLANTVGAVAPGMAADLVAVPLDPSGPADPLYNVLESDLQPSAVYIGGRSVGGARKG